MKKQKGKTEQILFCELGLTENQNVLLESGGEAKSQENRTKSYRGGLLCKCSSSHIKTTQQHKKNPKQDKR